MRVKQPVPYVFFAWPGRKQAWPNKAAGWSPALPQMGIPARASNPGMPGATVPYTWLLGQGWGSRDIGISRAPHKSRSHWRV